MPIDKSTPLVKEIREFNQKIAEEDRKLIQQFTEKGLDELVNYYNKKYADQRGVIYRAQAPMNLGLDKEEEKQKDTLSEQENQDRAKLKAQRTRLEVIGSGSTNIKSILDGSQKPQYPIKVVFTMLQKENEHDPYLVERGRHSIPILLTEDKLIMLREESNPSASDILGEIAKNLGKRLIQQKEAAYNSKTGKTTSIQADHSNCNGIALGILKDLDIKDLKKVVEFEDRYIPLPKMLKYSQSTTFIQETYPDLSDKYVKFRDGDGTKTLMQYVEEGKAKGAPSRITEKMNQKRTAMKDVDSWQKYVELQLEKSQKKDSDGRS